MVFALFWRPSLTGARLGKGDTPFPVGGRARRNPSLLQRERTWFRPYVANRLDGIRTTGKLTPVLKRSEMLTSHSEEYSMEGESQNDESPSCRRVYGRVL